MQKYVVRLAVKQALKLVLVTMITNNTEERKVTTLVDRLEGEITRQAMQFLLETTGEINILEKDIEE